MSNIEDLQKQLTEMQAMYSYQQEMIESLNDTVVKQWRTIDILSKRVGECADQIVAVTASLDGEASEPPPPHY